MTTRYGYHSDRQYWVWVRGEKAQTSARVGASNKTSALIAFATRRNLKTIQCDGVWLKPGSPAAYAYVAQRDEW